MKEETVEDRLFTQSAPTLVNLAALRVAEVAWKSVHPELPVQSTQHLIDNPEKKVFELIRRLDMPATLLEKVSIIATKMSISLKAYHTKWPTKKNVFLKQVVWSDNVTINELETIREVINFDSDTFTDEEKFNIASTYCSLHEIKLFGRRLLKSRPDCVEYLYGLPVSYFWACVLVHGTHRLYRLWNRYYREVSRVRTVSIEATEWKCALNRRKSDDEAFFQGIMRILANIDSISFSAFRYFWRSVDSESKVDVLAEHLRESHTTNMHLFMMDLTREQQETLLSLRGYRFLEDGLDNPLNQNYTLAITSRISGFLQMSQLFDLVKYTNARITDFHGFPSAYTTYMRILRRLFSGIGVELRQEFLMEKGNYLVTSFTALDLDTLAYLLNAAFSGADKDTVIRLANSEFGRHVFERLIENGQLEKAQGVLEADARLYDISFSYFEKCEIGFKIVKNKKDELFAKFVECMFDTEEARAAFVLEFPEVILSDLMSRSEVTHKQPTLAFEVEALNEYVEKCTSTDECGHMFRIGAAFKESWPARRKVILENVEKALLGKRKIHES